MLGAKFVSKGDRFTNQVVFSLRPEKDAYGVRAILPRPEGRGLSRFLVSLDSSVAEWECLARSGLVSRSMPN